jgi:acyl-CoA thioesterase-1
VLVELGANDGLRGLSPAEMKNNLTEITRRSQNVGAKVMLLGMKIPPNYGKRYVEMFYEVFPQLSAELKIPWVPFILEEVALNPEMMQADGLHPNELAQPVIAEKVWGYLQTLL